MLSKYDREELYEKVWERPMIRVAEEYGVSAVALGKVCRKLSVPTPGRGHWAKLAHGYKGTRKPPLQILEKIPVVFRSRISEQKPAAAADPELSAIDDLLSSGTLNLPLDSSTVTEPNVLIRRTRSRLRSRSRKDERGILLPSKPDGLDVRVTSAALDRALEVMSMVLSVLERQGFKIDITGQGSTVACVNGQRVLFSIVETIRQIVTQKPRIANPKHSWDYDTHYRYEPTGALVLLIDFDIWPPQNLRKKWSDGKKQRVEDLIPDFVAGLMRTAVALRRHHEELKRQADERQRQEQERIKLRQQIEEEEKKLKQFNQWVDDWEKAERLRQFIAVYAEKASKWSEENQSRYKEWIEWANEQADRLDPFISVKPPSVLDHKRELNWW